jgi:LAO/AO transport system kinase
LKNKSNINTLKVNAGIEQPPAINLDSVSKFKKNKRKIFSVDEYLTGIINQDRNILSQAITLIESSLPEHQKIATELIEKCLPYSGNSKRIGITGIPGVGKSTFIETFGKFLTSQGNKIAVLAIDPSSEKSKGSILGDKTRMENLATDNYAFIRPSPSSGNLGGVAQQTRNAIILFEAAGFNIIIIETVGVGQSETVVHKMVDVFVLLMLTGAGDELQGIKRGIMEMADLFLITKADGNNVQKANLTKSQIENAIHYLPVSESGFMPKVSTCSVLKNDGIENAWNLISEYFKTIIHNNYFIERRLQQSTFWMYETINNALKRDFYNNSLIKSKISELELEIKTGKKSSYQAANEILEEFRKLSSK